jgi:hypothetical protein
VIVPTNRPSLAAVAAVAAAVTWRRSRWTLAITAIVVETALILAQVARLAGRRPPRP